MASDFYRLSLISLILSIFIRELGATADFDDLDNDIIHWQRYNVLVQPPPAIDRNRIGRLTLHHRRRQDYDFSLLCADGVPLLLEDDRPKRCSPKPYKDDLKCPHGFWCHVGFSEETNYCCPRNKKIRIGCHLPPNVGYGKSEVPRFYYDWKKAKCSQMIYTGVGGNENNFVSYSKCVETCKGSGRPSEGEDVYNSVVTNQLNQSITRMATPTTTREWTTETTKAITTPWTTTKKATTTTKMTTTQKQNTQKTTKKVDSTTPRLRMTTTRKRPLTTATSTVRTTTTEDYEYTTSASRETTSEGTTTTRFVEGFTGNPCSLSPDRGTIRGEGMIRWYFDSSAQNCVQFKYLGSAGNSNRFESSEKCLETCGAGRVHKSSCVEAVESGYGPFKIPRWYFDAQATKCVRFMYTGEQGSNNRFLTRRKCERVCVKGGRRSSKTTVVASVPTEAPEEEVAQVTVAPRPYSATSMSRLKGKGRPPTTTQLPTVDSGYSTMRTNHGQLSTYINPKAMEVKQLELQTYAPPIGSPPLQSGTPRGPDVENDLSVITPSPHSPCRIPPRSDPVIMCAEGVARCPQGTFCQIGAGQSICCPMIDYSACTQLAEPGAGPSQLARWYFDPITRQCTTFVFRGFQGNQNNFRSFSECHAHCGGKNPCPYGTPAIQTDVHKRCSLQDLSACPAGHFCFRDPESQDTSCCPTEQTTVEMGNMQTALPSGVPMTMGYTPEVPNGVPVTSSPSPTLIPNIHGSHSLFRINPCELPPDSGFGSSPTNRYFFDYSSGMCQPFNYLGSGGNDNNFVNLAACRTICPEFINPCPSGNPLLDESRSALFCGAYGSLCPRGSWCHQGGNRSTTVCCGEAYDPCSLPLAIGIGHLQIGRYFYNENSRQCEQFMYTGLRGNQNNFLSKPECEASCPVVENPCGSGLPALDAEGFPLSCSTVDESCPSQYYCHIGATAASTVCCIKEGDPCTLPIQRGGGDHVLNRWYYNRESKLCVSFVYGGKGGNTNNFLSRAACQQQCPEFQSPCPSGLPHIDMTGQFTKCAPGNSSCPTTYWCHVGANSEATVCCPGASDPCEQQMSVGTGIYAVSRFTFDQLTRTCRQFFYSGSGGNENNFATREACEQRCPVLVNPCAIGEPQIDDNYQPVYCTPDDDAMCSFGYFCHLGSHEHSTLCCPGKAEDPCAEEPIEGRGREQVQRFHFSALTQQCVSFTYNGLGGNQNNFRTKIECEMRCPVLINPCPSGQPASTLSGQYLLCSSASSTLSILSPSTCPSAYWCHVGDEGSVSVCCPGATDPCTLPISPGSGTISLQRFYFDKNFRKCVRFTYSGRGGNQNNFESLDECQKKCPEFVNPCAAGDPATASDGSIIGCTHSKCDGGFYCHKGGSDEYTVCCPKLGETPCKATMEVGDGTDSLIRWSYNEEARQCSQFTYKGRGGNENNFLTEDECRRTCPVFLNPCPNSSASWTSISKCDQNPDACPQGEWCHTGNDRWTNVCCPGATPSPCSLPLQMGVPSGFGPFTRYFFNSVSDRCEPFQYTGNGGNQNSFYTQEDCQRKCPGSSSSDPCSHPVQSGNGHLFLTRYYFHSMFGQCLPFVYMGNGGNSNNFESIGKCVHKCVVQKQMESHENNLVIRFNSHAKSGLRRPSEDTVDTSSINTQSINNHPINIQSIGLPKMNSFPTLAPLTNKQNVLFPDERLCPQGDPLKTDSGIPISCSVRQNVGCPSAGYVCIQMNSGDAFCCPNPQSFCLQPLSSSSCQRQIPIHSNIQQQYTYNPMSDTCVPLNYSGCGGNLNNFGSRILCSSICCNKGYNHLYKHKLLMMSDDPIEKTENSTKV